MKKLFVKVMLVVSLFMPAAVQAQVAWDSPMLLPPRPAPGLGIFLVDVSAGGLGVLGTWRPSTWNYGVRLGIAEAAGDEDLAIYGGIDYSAPLHSASGDFPLDVDWLVGAGLSVSDMVRVSLPLGLTMGHSFQGQNVGLTPYLSPRVVLDALFGNDVGDDLDLDLALDLGVDLRFRSGPLGGMTVRFGGTLGDRDAVAIGLVF